ncbi:uncharacterized protein LOC127509455 isoform X1 [Ctenopharyngodon idella]|uniref:uncharacterized protein LOC127509455 isoform X1 n=1 Tax=Ctenopharyngodon idella TaxID=7959 RepID=UPI0022311848|nr:uncharacterized protein LOC127509455 isoform X1 [Ctenopharyngodon idella]
MDIKFIVISMLLMIADGTYYHFTLILENILRVFLSHFLSNQFLYFLTGFTVRSPSGPLVVPLGSSVVLPCYVDEPLLTEGLEVEWRRTDSETPVHLFLDGESRPEAQQQDYHDRVHFFTEEIQHGNFSLSLDKLRAEDEEKYTCKVYSGQDSGETEVQIAAQTVVQTVERLLVSGSNRSISASVGEDVTLNCSVDSHITPEHIEQVKWIRTDEDILVLLYENNKTLSDSSDKQYRDRVEFFTDEIPKGNFSLRLKSVRTEDKGVYMCEVFAGGLSANATVVLERLGFSSWHITVLVFCFVAGSGAVLLLCCLIYCRSKNTVSSSTIWNLQLSLVFFPNICMFFTFIFWGLTEGFLHETVTCCALYILRPVMLIWAYLKYLQDNIKTWNRCIRITSEFAVFSVIVYSVIFNYGWRKRAHDTSIIPRVLSGIYLGVFVLLCLLLSAVDSRPPSQQQPRVSSRHKRTLDKFFLCIFAVSLSQLIQLITLFGLPSPVFLIVIFVQPLVLPFIRFLPFLQTKFKCLRQRWITLLWIITITLLDIILVIYIHLTILEREKECVGWICVIVFIEVLKMIVFYENRVTAAERSRDQTQRQQTETSQQRSNTFHLCHEIMYMFGAVGLVLLSSVTLTAELILKARNGERVLKDLGVIVFPSECVFALYWLGLQMHAYWKIDTTESTHNQRNSDQGHRHQLRNTAETHEMENLSEPAVSQTQ